MVSSREMVFSGLLVIFAIATLGDIPSTKKGTRTNKSAANTAPPKNAFQNTFIMANFTRVLRRQPTWRVNNVMGKESGLPSVCSCRYRQTPEYTTRIGSPRI